MHCPAMLSNNGMHPTRISMNLIVSLGGFEVECGRVMPGVSWLLEMDATMLNIKRSMIQRGKTMRRLIARLSTGFLTFAIGISVSAWFTHPHPQVNPLPEMLVPVATTQEAIPDGWKRIDLKAFSFYAPPDMKDQHARGIDSAVWRFRNRSITLDLDFGLYSNDLTFYSDQPEYRAEWTEIGGKKARIATLRMRDESLANSLEKDRNYVATVYFPDVHGARLTFWANCVDAAAQESAKKIFLTIKFK
jgi:hypothetical protein